MRVLEGGEGGSYEIAKSDAAVDANGEEGGCEYETMWIDGCQSPVAVYSTFFRAISHPP